MVQQRAVIIGAGPAGLTAALELLRRTKIRPIVLEATDAIGGLSRTVQYKGNRMDIGGHRFFSKSDRVMQWWLDLMPLESDPETEIESGAQQLSIRYHGEQRNLAARATVKSPAGPYPNHVDPDHVILVRPRKSRIYFLRRFFHYPLRLTPRTLLNLGAFRTCMADCSYLRAAMFPRRVEQTLEDFLVNRFGRQLYRLFFESYTEKVWGVPCSQISAEWGSQRIKGLSLRRLVVHFIKAHIPLKKRHSSAEISQKGTETSLIEQFIYPKLGPGQLWEHVADLVGQDGGEIQLNSPVDRIVLFGNRISAVEIQSSSGERISFPADYVFSAMPVQDLIRAFSIPAPEQVRAVSEGLVYRDFITIGLLASKPAVHEKGGSPLCDNWIYIQEPDVQVGRVQIFNNWSPAMVADPDKVWIGLEYFCYQTDPIWTMNDTDLIALASKEIAQIGLMSEQDILDAHVVRVPKTYPAYFGSYGQLRHDPPIHR